MLREEQPPTVQEQSLPMGTWCLGSLLRNEWVSKDKSDDGRGSEIKQRPPVSAQKQILEETQRSPEKTSTESHTKD